MLFIYRFSVLAVAVLILVLAYYAEYCLSHAYAMSNDFIGIIYIKLFVLLTFLILFSLNVVVSK